MRYRLALVALALVLATAPAMPMRPAAAETARAPVGLPVYTSDGKAIGKVVALALDEDDEQVLVAEIERPLGIGSEAVAIPIDLFTRKQDRIELTITEAEVDARLGRPENKR